MQTPERANSVPDITQEAEKTTPPTHYVTNRNKRRLNSDSSQIEDITTVIKNEINDLFQQFTSRHSDQTTEILTTLRGYTTNQ